MNIFLKYLNGDIISIKTTDDTNLKTIKNNINNIHDIKLFFSQQELDDDEKTLKDYSIKDNDTILVFINYTSIPLKCITFDKGNTDYIKFMYEPTGNYGKVELPLDRKSEWAIELIELKHFSIGLVSSRIVKEEHFLPIDFKGIVFRKNSFINYNGEYMLYESRHDYRDLSITPEIGDKWLFEFDPFEKYLRIRMYNNKDEDYKIYFEDKDNQFWLYTNFYKYDSPIIITDI